MTDCPFQPVAFNVVVELDPTETVTKGGIILPDAIKDKDKLATEEGTLVAVSPAAFTYASDEDWGDGKPQIGARVMIKRYDGQMRERDGKTYRIIEDKSLIAIIKDSITAPSLAAAA